MNNKKSFFPCLTFEAQNMLSLNISTKSLKTDAKLKLVTKNKADIIFLSDTRLNTDSNRYGIVDIQKKISFLGYCSYFNSPGPSRGVGILLKKSLEHSVLTEATCGQGNFLLIKIRLPVHDEDIVIGSIYVPNDNNLNFFDILQQKLESLGTKNIVLGGDWNLTFDVSPVKQNIDCLKMQDLPSKPRSERLRNLCRVLKLHDPFRVLHPNNREFTYVPNNRNLTNRSRIDFFLVTESIISSVNECKISCTNIGRIFDHKGITLFTGSVRRKRT